MIERELCSPAGSGCGKTITGRGEVQAEVKERHHELELDQLFHHNPGETRAHRRAGNYGATSTVLQGLIERELLLQTGREAWGRAFATDAESSIFTCALKASYTEENVSEDALAAGTERSIAGSVPPRRNGQELINKEISVAQSSSYPPQRSDFLRRHRASFITSGNALSTGADPGDAHPNDALIWNLKSDMAKN